MEEKKAKNKKTNLGGSYKFKIAKKYNKPITKGDKIANRRKKKQLKTKSYILIIPQNVILSQEILYLILSIVDTLVWKYFIDYFC